MAGARALNGNTATNNNYSSVTPTAQQAIGSNSVLGVPIANAQLSLNIGRYVYNSSTQQFEGQFPGPSTQNWSMVQATVTPPRARATSNAFSNIFNFLPSLQAVSTAAHQPRDICLILDYSGSMRFGSLLGLPYSGNRSGNNLNPVYPQFGAILQQQCRFAGHRAQLSVPRREHRLDHQRRPAADRPRLLHQFYRRGRLFGRCQQLRHDSGRRHSPQDQQEHGRFVRPNAVGYQRTAEHQLAHHLDARRDVRITGLQGLRHGIDVQWLYAGARLLGQDVPHLASRSHQRLAQGLFHLFRRHARQFGALGQLGQLAGPR